MNPDEVLTISAIPETSISLSDDFDCKIFDRLNCFHYIWKSASFTFLFIYRDKKVIK